MLVVVAELFNFFSRCISLKGIGRNGIFFVVFVIRVCCTLPVISRLPRSAARVAERGDFSVQKVRCRHHALFVHSGKRVQVVIAAESQKAKYLSFHIQPTRSSATSTNTQRTKREMVKLFPHGTSLEWNTTWSRAHMSRRLKH